MTSSSDTEFCRRRIYVEGIPPKCTRNEVKSFFTTYGSVSLVHLSARHGYGFVTFEEETSAHASLAANGQTFMGVARLSVELDSTSRPPFPVTAAKREIHFPKPFCGRGASSGQRSGGHALPRTGGRGQRLERRTSLPNMVKVIHAHVEEVENTCPNKEVYKSDYSTLPSRYANLFSLQHYPHIAKKIFLPLDAVSLLRCRLVCRYWAASVSKYCLNQAKLDYRWDRMLCSIYPLTPQDGAGLMWDNPEARYRNVLSVKVDENDIMLAVDNGNVEIYDRYTRKMTCLLAGQYSVSPVGLDCNVDLILVHYTCAFASPRRRLLPPSWWNVFCRKTKRLLRSIDRENNSEEVRLGYDNFLYVANKSAIYAIDVLQSAKVQTKIAAVYQEDTIEAMDMDSNRICAVVKRNSQPPGAKLTLNVWKRPQAEDLIASETVDFMTRLESMFHILTGYNALQDFDEAKCKCLSVQFRYPLCLAMLSNNNGFFEVLGDRGKPYVLLAISDVTKEQCLRVLTLDCAWMLKMTDLLVPYDCDTCILSAKFNNSHLVAGLGSFSDPKDGGIALWSMEELIGEERMEDEDNLTVWSLPAPVYHWAGWDCHTGGVSSIHIDTLGVIAVNACRHQVTTRCIERGDESRKDNVLVYDFWQIGTDERREQK